MSFNSLNVGKKVNVIVLFLVAIVIIVLTLESVSSLNKNEKQEIQQLEEQILNDKKLMLATVITPVVTLIKSTTDEVDYNKIKTNSKYKKKEGRKRYIL